jgi:hypothetical protein
VLSALQTASSRFGSVPIAVAAPTNSFQRSGTVLSAALTAGALVVAESHKGKQQIDY